MAITKHDIDNVSLNIVKEGYDPEEVDVLLERLGEEVDAFNRALLEAASRIEAAESRAKAAEAQATQSAQLAQASSGHTAASEHQIAQVLIAAQKSADELRDGARIEAERVQREGEQQARDIVRNALSEKQRIIEEVDRLRTSTEKFRSEYMAVLNRFTAEAQKTMPTLEENKPDIAADKKSTEEAIQVLKEGDAAFKAPELKPADEVAEPANAEPASSSTTSSFGSGSGSSFNQPVSAYSDTSFRAQDFGSSSTQNQSQQSAFDFDEDLDIDIEEID